jgi:hypothetical protein
MNWFEIFYWVMVADGVASLLLTLAIIFTVITGLSIIGMFVCAGYLSSAESYGGKDSNAYRSWVPWNKAWRKTFSFTIIPAIVFGLACVFVPTKREAMIIIAGGAVGQFITSDSSAKHIPSEFTLLIREKMKAEIEEIRSGNILGDAADTLKNKSQEELIKIIKEKTK